MEGAERIQKVLSREGHGSRREIERWMVEGLVKINGVVAKLGDKASPSDKIVVNGKPVRRVAAHKAKTRVLMYYKPVGEICSRSDPKFTETVFDHLPKITDGRWIQIGRLDLNTSGLLLFTNDGELANQLMHPKFEIEREYAVRVHGAVTPQILKTLRAGVLLEEGMARFHDIRSVGGDGANAWYHVILKEGRYREVRRLWQSQGLEVSRLIRLRYGCVTLPRFLSRGEWKELTGREVNDLRRLVIGHG